MNANQRLDILVHAFIDTIDRCTDLPMDDQPCYTEVVGALEVVKHYVLKRMDEAAKEREEDLG